MSSLRIGPSPGVSAAIVLMLCACSYTPKSPPNVVIPPPGETLTSIPGPMPNFGPFASIEDAIAAACPLIMSQPDAIIPVPATDQNFKLYWNISTEYCAWFYSPDGKNVEMSLFAASAVQDDASKRQCKLPAYVLDRRYSAGAPIYLVIIHSHPVDKKFDDEDYLFLDQMARLHGLTPTINGKQVSMSIVAYTGRIKAGKPSCTGYYQYSPADDGQVRRVVVGEDGHWRAERLGRVRWSDDGTPRFERN